MASIEITSNRFRALRMTSIAQDLADLLSQAEGADLSHLAFAELLAEHEQKQRTAKRILANRSKAKFPSDKRLEEFDYGYQTTIRKREVNALLDFEFIEQRQNLIFIGPPGVGKTHLAIGIAQKAIEEGFRVLFRSAYSLVEELELAELKGELKAKLTQLCKYDVLIIDELGYLPVNAQSKYNLFQLVNAFYEFRSLILTTNKVFTDWAEFFHNDNVAIPIVDRLIHHSKVFILGVESYRLKEKQGN